ncbi:MAG TPA: MCE family protein [Saprospiraceae bacterium]|nr:MCE family protein [Saprospiraceae bacterium]
MNKSNTQKIKLSLFVLLSTILLVFALYSIGNKKNMFIETFKISSVFNNVNGLILGNNVRFSGINVGTVKHIQMINDTSICVDMVIDKKIQPHIKKNAVAMIGSDGLVGNMIVNIIPGHGISPPIVEGDTIVSFSKISTNDMMTTLNTTNENAALLTADLLKITTNINSGNGTISLLLRDSLMANDLRSTLLSLKQTANEASKMVSSLNQIIESIHYENSVAGVLLSDSVAANQMAQTITSFEKSGQGIQETIAKLRQSADSVQHVITNVNNMLLDAQKGDGALNYLINDTLFTKNLGETAKNLKQSTILLNQDLEALQHNFLLRRYFKKLKKKEKKKK